MDPQSDEERGEIARMFVGAMAISDLVKTTLGTKGMDKILQSLSHQEAINVTNDGTKILKSIVVDNPAAHLIVELSQAQDKEVVEQHLSHAQGKTKYGLGIIGRGDADVERESFKVKRQIVISATEAAVQILSVDEIVMCKPAPKQKGR